ncbi:MAG: class I fructose-bisphosphate aldolase [Opitutaceae bacterium]
MNIQKLTITAQALMADHKGLLAMDESTSTCNRRFAQCGISQDPEARRRYRELIVTAPGLAESISGAILFDETLRQRLSGGLPFAEALTRAGIVPGIKVDLGAKDLAGFPSEKVTEGLDGLRGRLDEYARMGARFAKWRAVIAIGEETPTAVCLDANAHALARYAALCQEAALVPIVEPEVLMDGGHTIERCEAATRDALRALFGELARHRVDLRGLILKPAMVVPGKDGSRPADLAEVAKRTVGAFLDTVPASVPGIAFLSGGQSGEMACARLNAMNADFKGRMPWALTFSFSRAIQHPALEIWAGKDVNTKAAQEALVHRARCSRAARQGRYDPSMEGAAPIRTPGDRPLANQRG